ncbi:hypothetical protein GCM10008090_16980 [Arenicella chitinivorans]|uniref:Uncharacterized protein n=1 Tax=Arenicella chitinivorans TaxID=1329800 RepID=A0A918RQX3_9GAMM|nr:hypothetical protein GCM10008090_16980 [Arenicella chitinivorans]
MVVGTLSPFLEVVAKTLSVRTQPLCGEYSAGLSVGMLFYTVAINSVSADLQAFDEVFYLFMLVITA